MKHQESSYDMTSASTTNVSGCAVVLSGGGLLGACWQAGLCDGFAEAGLALADADLLIGTSAGAIAGSQIMVGAELRDLALWVEHSRGGGERYATPEAYQQMFEAMAQAFGGDDPEQGRRRVGRAARETQTVPIADYLAFFSYLGEREWPNRFRATAVDIESGQLRVWGPDSKIDLARGVASSGAAPLIFPSVQIGDRWYMDGGVQSNLNAGLAAGAERVVVIDCLPINGVDTSVATMEGLMARQSVAEVAALRDEGTRVEVIEPGPDLLAVVMTEQGPNYMDYAKAQQAFDAGRRESVAALHRIRVLWSDPA